MENEFDELTESSFRRWVITNFSEPKEHVLNQCKETKNVEKRLDKMLSRMTSLEKNTIWELHEVCTGFNSQIDQAEESILEVEDQLNEMKMRRQD